MVMLASWISQNRGEIGKANLDSLHRCGAAGRLPWWRVALVDPADAPAENLADGD